MGICWTDGQLYICISTISCVCRSKGYDLATIRSESDINQVLVDGFYAWIGLELLYQGWTWADGQLNVLDNWGHDEPDHSEYKTFIYSKDRR